MLLQKYNSIMEREEGHRKKWALGFTISIFTLILIGFGFYKGFLSINYGGTVTKTPAKNTATVIQADQAPSPVESSKETFKAAFGEIEKQYNNFIGTLSAVFVPFVTGIDVYERQ